VDVAQKFNNRRARSHKQVPKGMGNNIMTAIANNHLVEIIEETANGLWLGPDTGILCRNMFCYSVRKLVSGFMLSA